MKLVFTTLGCPKWDLETIVAKAKEYGYDGVDFRGYLKRMNLWELPEFTTGLKDTIARFEDTGLDVPCLSSSARFFANSQEKLTAALDEVKHYADLCVEFNTPSIRIFGGAIGDTPREEATKVIVENLLKAAETVKDAPVGLLVETHDDWTDSKIMKSVMEQVDHEKVGVLWDTHHPCRNLGEKPVDTFNNLKKWIRNTHWKDSYPDKENRRGYQLSLMGEGTLPQAEIYASLKNGGYDGYLTLEWEKMWAPEIAEPEVAFPGFVKYMRGLMKE